MSGEMKSRVHFAAVWPVKAASKEDYIIVPVSCVKNFSPAHTHDFQRQDIYKFKVDPNAKSALGHILVLGETKNSISAAIDSQRIRYPNRRNVDASQPVPSSTDDEARLCKKKETATVRRQRQHQANMTNSQSILARYISKMKENMSDSAEPPQNPLFKPSAPPLTSGGNRPFAAQACDAKSLREIKEIENTVKKYCEQAAEHCRKAEVERKEAECQRQKAVEERERAEAERTKAEEFCKKTMSVYVKFEEERTALLNALTARNLGRMPSSSSIQGGKEMKAGDDKVHLGSNVFVADSFWGMAMCAKSKEEWAQNALIAAFGTEAKNYRAGRPRDRDDPLLKRIPPTHLLVFQKHYATFLKENPSIVTDYITGKKYRGKIPSVNEENEEVESLSNAAKEMVKSLPGLLGDKAKGMHRNGNRKPLSEEVRNKRKAKYEEEKTNKKKLKGQENRDKEASVEDVGDIEESVPIHQSTPQKDSNAADVENDTHSAARQKLHLDDSLSPESRKFLLRLGGKQLPCKLSWMKPVDQSETFRPLAVSTQIDESQRLLEKNDQNSGYDSDETQFS